MKTKHVFIEGKVQGVFFRDNAKNKADELDVKGWIKNLADGRVEAVFSGDDKNVEEIIGWCRQGPSSADVTYVNVRSEEPKEFDDFEVRY